MEQTYKPPLTNEQTSYRSEAEWQTEGERARPTAWQVRLVYGCHTEPEQCSRGAYIIGIISLGLHANDLLIHVRSEVGKEGSNTLKGCRVPAGSFEALVPSYQISQVPVFIVTTLRTSNFTSYRKLQTYWGRGGGVEHHVVCGYNCMLQTRVANFLISGEK